MTLTEVLVATAIGVALIFGVMLWIRTSLSVSRHQLERARNTDQARVQLQRIGDVIRNSQYMDCLDDVGDPGTDGHTDTHWLVADQWLPTEDPFDRDFYLEVYSNIDSDADIELVGYYYIPERAELYRAVGEHNSSDPDPCLFVNPQLQLIMSGLRNNTDEPVFSYFGINGEEELIEPLRVGITLVAGNSESSELSPVTVSTVVTPRSVPCQEADCSGRP